MNEASFEDLYQHAPCGYLTIDGDGRVTIVNETFLALGGWQRSAVEGQLLRDLLDTGSQIFYETRHLPILKLSGSVREVALTLRVADGGTLPVLVNAVTADDGVRFAVFDSTVRGQYERELVAAKRAAEASEARVRALQDAATTFGLGTVEASLTQTLADTVRIAVSALSSAVMLVDGSGPLTLAAGSNPLMADFPPDAARPSTKAFETASVVIISSVEDARLEFPEVAEAMRANRVESLIVTPLLAEEIPVGVVACFFGRQRTFDTATVDLQLALARQAAQAIARVRLQRQLELLALHDPLTGLGNRALLHEQVSQAITAGARDGAPVALMFLDLDGFKAINDHLGHAAGDGVLKEVAARLRSAVRNGDAVGRYGGDEFVAICEGVDPRVAEEIADRIRDVIRAPFEGIPDRFPLTASVGVALCNPSETVAPTPEMLLDIADAAMYRAKNGGRDRVAIELVGLL